MLTKPDHSRMIYLGQPSRLKHSSISSLTSLCQKKKHNLWWKTTCKHSMLMMPQGKTIQEVGYITQSMWEGRWNCKDPNSSAHRQVWKSLEQEHWHTISLGNDIFGLLSGKIWRNSAKGACLIKNLHQYNCSHSINYNPFPTSGHLQCGEWTWSSHFHTPKAMVNYYINWIEAKT